jgi:acyl-CoA reductase-like NAD-dependent aldehyde dehydrogenase
MSAISNTASGDAPVRGLFIDGAERAASSADLIDVYDPSRGEVIARIAHATDADVDAAVQSARRAFSSGPWATMSVRARARLVNTLADALEAHLEELYQLETRNNGRPITETRAQLGRLPDFFRYNAGLALARRDAVIPVEGDYLCYTQRTPVGVVGNCTPFNHPLMIMAKSLAPVFATGCTTVVKCSEYTPLTTLRLAQIFVEAGLPAGVFNVVTGLGATTGKALAEHPGIAKFVLTGGTEAGRISGSLAARNFAHQTLELGGKTPVIVFDDFNVEQAVNYAAFGAFVAAGQTCVCAARHIVQRSVYDEFVERLARKAAGIRVGDPALPSTQMGPVISARQRERVMRLIDIAQREGARTATGGGRPQHLEGALENGYFVEPTVFADVKPSMTIAREEVFGPVTVVIPFDHEDEAVAIANDSPYGLAAGVRTADVARAHRIARRVECGIFWINDHHRLDPASPWGGIKESGIGSEFGTESFDAHFHTKAVMTNVSGKPFDWYGNVEGPRRLN